MISCNYKFRSISSSSSIVQIVKSYFGANLTPDVVNYYQVNDYIMIEGYLSFVTKQIIQYTVEFKTIQITVLKFTQLISFIKVLINYIKIKNSSESFIF
jgi:hypothetical protein